MGSNSDDSDFSGFGSGFGSGATDDESDNNEFDKAVHEVKALFLEVMSAEDIVNDMNEQIEIARSVIGESYTKTRIRILLSETGWDVQHCINRFLAQQSRDPQEGSSGIHRAVIDQDDVESSFENLNIGHKLECLICQEDVELCEETKNCFCSSQVIPSQEKSPLCSSNGLRMHGCRHILCKSCVTSHIDTKISDVGSVYKICCPVDECDFVIDDEIIIALLNTGTEETKAAKIGRYKQLIANSYIQKSHMMRWCPSSQCRYALKADQSQMKKAVCRCGKVICIKCGKDWHDPIPCSLLAKWLSKFSNFGDGANEHNIAANKKKPCPNPMCMKTIERNATSGCNIFTCPKCEHQFCWVCMQPWSEHSRDKNCSVFQKSENTAAQTDSTGQRVIDERYLHYGNRYNIHTSSLGKIPDLRSTKGSKVFSLMDNFQMSSIDVRFLEEATDRLVKCRQILSYTYAFLYYLENNNPKHILEEHQSDLEIMTENLTAELERVLDDEPFVDKNDFSEYRQKVRNYTTYCEQRIDNLLEHVAEGNDKEWWAYNDSDGYNAPAASAAGIGHDTADEPHFSGNPRRDWDAEDI